MRLLFDQNLSDRLRKILADIYPDSLHVTDIGLHASDDVSIWGYSKDNGFTTVSKD